ncbi:anthranilate phosphoribosyltransferase [Candidatus Steffania adelgidicola]|uniref:anthranilate phosphoribosyltransferase n=1 Tax=Candidatus Steffania adelgidicola TaxID=1076626 RepID=UPI001D028E9A|nr:anthranilate phosphoribosyltransferase [Candidatus Steffania adelgidicola]UDG80199.1 anthranilate phosphoribosyltransferase [Candidatus Steffania adelgidicola]
MQTILEHLYVGGRMNRETSQQLFEGIIQGQLAPEQLAAVLISMKVRGEHPEEIAGATSALLAHASSFPRPDYLFADIVGTGGDSSNSINISTASAIVSASCGAHIAKHGNGGVSSCSGSADLLTAFGIRTNMPAEISRQALDELGICFLFAPQYNSGLRYTMPVRKLLKTRTIFNILGPLLNPARPPLALIGVYSPQLVLPIAKTLQMLDYHRAAVVHSGGMDEVALHAPTQVAELREGMIDSYTLNAADFGLLTQSADALRGGSPEENRDILKCLLQGNGKYAHAAVVAANVALLLKLFGHENLRDNTHRALHEIHSGSPYLGMLALAEKG